ncbi:helix-turn-helix domain-containing protein [Nocardia sp. NPDC048505]|uniref:helix-turn-helix domain-containing protein n=1 Tax=unclassified Nocardia TaxID=2637762 RepID=UPI0033F0E0A6
MEPTTEVVTAAPAPALAGFIDHYLGYRMTGYRPGLHRGLPSRHLTFIVAIGPTIDVVAQTDPRQRPADYRCVLSGLQATPAAIAHGGDQEGVAIALTPLGSRTLFGVPAGELWNVSLEFADLAGPVGDELWERLQGPASWPQRFAACDQVLTRLACPDRLVVPELAWAWRAVVDSGGTTGIGALSTEIGWSRQHLARKFGAEFGLSPKLAARVTRFERARRMLERTPSFVTIAQVAATCGYYDQAHLNRDFAELAGCSPTTWLSEEIPSVQDDRGAPGRT